MAPAAPRACRSTPYLAGLSGYCFGPADWDIDAFGGSIITDWYALPSRPDERIKLSVFVLDRELRSDAVRVIVYVQKRQDGLFVDAGIDTELSDRLEELILTRARELRATVENGAE